MIDQTEFSAWMSVFSDRYGRELKGPTVRAYYAILAPELTTEQFVLGCQRALKREAFMPTPQAIIDAAQPPASAELLAADAWTAVLRIAGRSYAAREDHTRETPEAKLAAMEAAAGAVAVTAWDGAGGFDRFNTIAKADVTHMRREFIAAYREAYRLERERGEVSALAAAKPLRLIRHTESARFRAQTLLAPADDVVEVAELADVAPEVGQ